MSFISTNKKIIVTGAAGFIGRSFCHAAGSIGYEIHPVIRTPLGSSYENLNHAVVTIDESTNWSHLLPGVFCVVHLAGLAHTYASNNNNLLHIFRRINVEGTLNLARQAAEAGVKRFVFVSSIGVNGAESFDQPFCADDLPAPHSPYAVSKHEAEIGLKALAAITDMEVVIIRPPLVYGLNAPGNFGNLTCWLERGIPLPLGSIYNKRSFVALDNLVDLILCCTSHPAAADQTFLVSDGEDLSTTDFLRRMARAMERRSRLIPVPAMLLKIGAAMLGKSGIAQSLCGSLQVDIGKTCTLLNWSPPISVDEGLLRAVRKQI